jgi:hypothetical protein
MSFFEFYNREREQSPKPEVKEVIAKALGDEEAENYIRRTEELGKQLDGKIQEILKLPNRSGLELFGIQSFADFQRYSEGIFSKDNEIMSPALRAETIRQHVQDAFNFLDKMITKADEVLRSRDHSAE